MVARFSVVSDEFVIAPVSLLVWNEEIQFLHYIQTQIRVEFTPVLVLFPVMEEKVPASSEVARLSPTIPIAVLSVAFTLMRF